MIPVKKMRKAGNLVWDTFHYIRPHIIEGVTTEQLDEMAHNYIISKGGYPAPLGYSAGGQTPFPKSICTSVNNILAHGIPSPSTVLRNGDLISVDISLDVDGYYGDACQTFAVGDVEDDVEEFLSAVEAVHSQLLRFVDENVSCITTGDIGYHTELLSEAYGIYIVPGCGGHGIGLSLHEDPFIPPTGTPGEGMTISPGMYITVEPIFTMNPVKPVLDVDGWTIFAPCGTLSAQLEHTIYIKKTGIEILT